MRMSKAQGLTAHAEGLRSLDVRLKDVPEICDMFLQLLQSLQQDLNDLRYRNEAIARPGKAESNHADDLEMRLF
jgi:hypothetical protein